MSYSQSTSGRHRAPSSLGLYRDVVRGMRASKKHIPCKYFYDARGSKLFDQICELDEYYLTRTELQIMRDNVDAIARRLGERTLIVELGSGSSTKTRILLDHMNDPAAYCPVDISRDHLLQIVQQLTVEYPSLEVLPIAADFVDEFELPQPELDFRSVSIYFPGSTIGNFEPADASSLLKRIAGLCKPRGGLLIGIDLQKDVDVIEAAYNDTQGVTDRFNLNVLNRINRELDADFNIDQFRHRAYYDEDLHRVDISLVSQARQTVSIRGETFALGKGEAIHTEYSHKYTIDSFAALARASGLTLIESWTDEQAYFGVLYLRSR